MPRRAPLVDPFTRDAEGNRIFPPGTVSKRKHATLTDREREIYRDSLLPLQEQQHARFCELHQESLENVQRREAMRIALPIVETDKPAEESLQEELARKAIQRKDRLNKAAVRRNWQSENDVQSTQPLHKRLQDDESSTVAGIEPTHVERQPAKRRRIQTEEVRAKAIVRQAERKASERMAMSISLPEVPEWVGDLVEPEMERLLATSTHSSRILQSQAEAKAHKMGKSHADAGISATPSELKSPENETIENEWSTVAENGLVWAFTGSDDLLAYNTGMRCYSPQVSNGLEDTTESIDIEDVPARRCTGIQDDIESLPNSLRIPSVEAVVLKSALRERRTVVRSKPSHLTYKVFIHKLIVEVDGPLIHGSTRAQETLSSRNRFETFRRKIFNLNKGDLSGEGWSGVFIAYLKPNTAGTFSYWNFIHTGDDYTEYLHHIAGEDDQKEHHLVTGNRADAHLLPPPYPSRTPVALTKTNTEGDLSPVVTPSSAKKIDHRSVPAIPWFYNTCSANDQQNDTSGQLGGCGEGSLLSHLHMPSSEAVKLVDPGLRPNSSQPQATLTTQSHVIRPMASKTYWGFERQFSMSVEGESGHDCSTQAQSSYMLGGLANCHGVNCPPNDPRLVGLSAIEASLSIPMFEGQYRVVEPPFLSCLATFDEVRAPNNQDFNSLDNSFPNDVEIGISHPDFFKCVEDEGVSETFHTTEFLDSLAQGNAGSLPRELDDST
ncbi:hypothetical protein DFP73DRAFT_583266 [Morchella snyderi]|nr:hypothetical protein DFP73DRAFT_583266 [Morchella snyderi]